jgi:hypothetical protein
MKPHPSAIHERTLESIKNKDRTLEELEYIRKQYSFSRVIEMRVK